MKTILPFMVGAVVFGARVSESAPLPSLYSIHAVQISSSEPKRPVGSGFLLQASNSVYLVTARHVLFSLGTNGWKLSGQAVEVDAFHASGTSEEHVDFTLHLDKLLEVLPIV